MDTLIDIFSFPDAFDSIGSIMMDTTTFPNDEIRKALIGLSRDLRGIAYAFNAKPPYMMFFDWM